MHISETTNNGIQIWHIDTGRATAEISSQGAHLLSYGLTNQPDLIWRNPNAEFAPGTPIRGGIPVCFPWFGDLKANPSQIQSMIRPQQEAHCPFHGLVRQVEWQLDRIVPAEQHVTLCFRYDIAKEDFSQWPHACQLALEFVIGDTLTVHFTVHNTNSYPLPVTLALHTYYAVSDVECIQFGGFQGLHYYDSLDGWQCKHQENAPSITEETARTFVGVKKPLSISDPGNQRIITLESTNSQSCILWNPHQARSLKLDQFTGDAWQEIVCIETARVRENFLTIEPGSRETISLTVNSSDL